MLSRDLMSLPFENQGQFSMLTCGHGRGKLPCKEKRELVTKAVVGEVQIIIFVCMLLI